jgi:hypothetical protein
MSATVTQDLRSLLMLLMCTYMREIGRDAEKYKRKQEEDAERWTKKK